MVNAAIAKQLNIHKDLFEFISLDNNEMLDAISLTLPNGNHLLIDHSVAVFNKYRDLEDVPPELHNIFHFELKNGECLLHLVGITLEEVMQVFQEIHESNYERITE